MSAQATTTPGWDMIASVRRMAGPPKPRPQRPSRMGKITKPMIYSYMVVQEEKNPSSSQIEPTSKPDRTHIEPSNNPGITQP